MEYIYDDVKTKAKSELTAAQYQKFLEIPQELIIVGGSKEERHARIKEDEAEGCSFLWSCFSFSRTACVGQGQPYWEKVARKLDEKLLEVK